LDFKNLAGLRYWWRMGYEVYSSPVRTAWWRWKNKKSPEV